MARRGLVIHEVEDVERVEQQGEAVVTHGEDLVLGGLQEDPEDGDEGDGGGPSIQNTEVQLESLSFECPDFVQLLSSRVWVLLDKLLDQLHELVHSRRVLGRGV